MIKANHFSDLKEYKSNLDKNICKFEDYINHKDSIITLKMREDLFSWLLEIHDNYGRCINIIMEAFYLLDTIDKKTIDKENYQLYGLVSIYYVSVYIYKIKNLRIRTILSFAKNKFKYDEFSTVCDKFNSYFDDNITTPYKYLHYYNLLLSNEYHKDRNKICILSVNYLLTVLKDYKIMKEYSSEDIAINCFNLALEIYDRKGYCFVQKNHKEFEEDFIIKTMLKDQVNVELKELIVRKDTIDDSNIYVIGGGSYADVIVIDDEKCAKLANNKDLNKNILNELDILYKLKDSKYVIDVISFGYTKDMKMWYSMKKSGKNLFRRKLEDKEFDIIKKLSYGLKDIHDKNIIHNDINASNILYDKDNIIYIDFVISFFDNEIDEAHSLLSKHSSYHHPPEITCKYDISKHLNKGVDIWSLGLLFIYIYTKVYYSFNTEFNSSYHRTINKIYFVKDHKELIESIGNKIPNNILAIILKMLDFDIEKRLKIDEVITLINLI